MVADRAAHSRRTQLSTYRIIQPANGGLSLDELYGWHLEVASDDDPFVSVYVFVDSLYEPTAEMVREATARAEAIRDLLNAR